MSLDERDGVWGERETERGTNSKLEHSGSIQYEKYIGTSNAIQVENKNYKSVGWSFYSKHIDFMNQFVQL